MKNKKTGATEAERQTVTKKGALRAFRSEIACHGQKPQRKGLGRGRGRNGGRVVGRREWGGT